MEVNGFEPLTLYMQNTRSAKLSYTPEILGALGIEPKTNGLKVQYSTY